MPCEAHIESWNHKRVQKLTIPTGRDILHPQANSEPFSLSVLSLVYRQKVSVTLQQTQTFLLLRWAVVVCEGSSKLGILSRWSSSFLIWYASHNSGEGSRSLMFPLVIRPLRCFFGLLGCGASIFVPCIPRSFGCFGLYLILQGFIK